MVSISNEQKIGVVGAGLIGASWVGLFSAFGYETILYDPKKEAIDRAVSQIKGIWSSLENLHGKLENKKETKTVDKLEELKECSFLQENCPENLDLKQTLISDLEKIVSNETIIASSTSSFLPSELREMSDNPNRVLVGHPMNPPHLIPLVEIVMGEVDNSEILKRVHNFYLSLNRKPVHVKKEMRGHLANRLTAALYREAVYLVSEGIADVADVDAVISNGPGLRLALLGPHINYHLGGGTGGYRYYLEHLGPTQETRWQTLGEPSLTDEVKELLVTGIEDQNIKVDDLISKRDKGLAEILKIKKENKF
ncbi:MAG: 3-hydroxyacyl-CoA dehydrogenase family protein [Paracoccaceae bacterium]